MRFQPSEVARLLSLGRGQDKRQSAGPSKVATLQPGGSSPPPSTSIQLCLLRWRAYRSPAHLLQFSPVLINSGEVHLRKRTHSVARVIPM